MVDVVCHVTPDLRLSVMYSRKCRNAVKEANEANFSKKYQNWYQKLSSVCQKDQGPLPRMSEIPNFPACPVTMLRIPHSTAELHCNTNNLHNYKGMTITYDYSVYTDDNTSPSSSSSCSRSLRVPSRRCTTMSTVDSTSPEVSNRTCGMFRSWSSHLFRGRPGGWHSSMQELNNFCHQGLKTGQ